MPGFCTAHSLFPEPNACACGQPWAAKESCWMTDGSVHCSPASLHCLPLVSGRQPTLPCLPLPSSRPLCAAQGGGAADRHQRPVKAGTQRSRHSTYRSAAPQSGAHSRYQASCNLSVAILGKVAVLALIWASSNLQRIGWGRARASPCTCSCVRPCRLCVRQPSAGCGGASWPASCHAWLAGPPAHTLQDRGGGGLASRAPAPHPNRAAGPAARWHLGPARRGQLQLALQVLPGTSRRQHPAQVSVCVVSREQPLLPVLLLSPSSLTGRCSAATPHLQGICGRPAQGAIPGLWCTLPRAKRHRH